MISLGGMGGNVDQCLINLGYRVATYDHSE